MSELKYEPGRHHVKAIYTDAGKSWEIRNPLIAALQLEWTRELIARIMTWWPTVTDADRAASVDEREVSIRELAYCFESTSQHLDLAQEILAMIRFGYRGRDRFVHGCTSEIESWSDKLRDGRKISPAPHAKGLTLLISGLPGTGKTTFLTRLSVLLPQVIDHIEFGKRPWPCRQIVYLRVVVQLGWSDKNLAIAILEEFDRVAGTNYSAEALRRGGTAPAYLRTFNMAACNHGLGALMVDEVQLLENNRALLTFILNFNTLVGVPLVLAGTPDSVEVMRTEPHFMRRADSNIDSELKPFAFPTVREEEYNAMLADENAPRDSWTFFLEGFWDIQFLGNRARLTHELSFAMHYHSVGILDYAVKLFIACQLLCLGTTECFDKETIKQAYLMCFKTSLPYLEALRERRWSELRHLKAFKTVGIDIIARQAAATRAAQRNRDADARREEALRMNGKRRVTPRGPKPERPEAIPEADRDEYIK